jgi:choline-glycine betaine transporter
MIIACGIAVGTYVYGVAEPLWHQESHYYAQAGYRSQDEIDMFAINLTVTNWGFAGWISYVVVAVCMSLATHRFRLPMTLRSCFYPILGHYTWGWMGDMIDGLGIVVTVAGICTSLGLGVMQVVVGLTKMGWIDANNSSIDMDRIHNLTIWFFTIMSTASVVTGLHGGIQVLSLCAISLGCILLLAVLVLDDTKFLLNLQVQEVGYYIQMSIFQLNFWTDAFGQLREGSGRAVDGKASEEWWMEYVQIGLSRLAKLGHVAILTLVSCCAARGWCFTRHGGMHGRSLWGRL